MTETAALDGFVTALGCALWSDRIAQLAAVSPATTRSARASSQRHCIELTIERLRRTPLKRPPSPAERSIIADTAEALSTLSALSPQGREKFLAQLRASLAGQESLVPVFHLLRTAARRRSQGFKIEFAGFEMAAPFDLLIQRESYDAEVACDVFSAEAGREIHRGAWLQMVDALDGELEAWLRSNPGRYLLKMTLHGGLHDGDDTRQREVQAGIRKALVRRFRFDGDASATLRLEPLALPPADSDDQGLTPRLRRGFGPEAHLAAISADGSVLALAARAGRENNVATALSRHLDVAAPARLSGHRPGMMAMFIEDVDQLEWRLLRETATLEGEIRQFMTHKEASSVVAVSCTSRLELFGMASAGADPNGEVRFRNPAHPSAKIAALAPAVSSSS